MKLIIRRCSFVFQSKIQFVHRLPFGYFAKHSFVVEESQLDVDVIHCDDRIQEWFFVSLEILDRLVENLLGGPSLARIDNYHIFYDCCELRGVFAGRYWLVVALCYVFEEIHQTHFLVLISEGRLQFCELITDAAQRPNVSILIVTLILDELRRHVERCANFRVGL